MIVGLPLPNICDPYVVIKRELLLKKEPKWLDKVSMRAVNQAIGRVIRHSNDFGSIVLIEKRYSKYCYNSLLSKWVKDKLQHNLKPEEISVKIEKLCESNAELRPKASQSDEDSFSSCLGLS